jgi:hypothetical protein
MTELVAAPENAESEPLSSLEGAGAASSISDFVKALGEDDPDAFQIAFTAAGAGLDTLGVIVDPFDAALSSAVGWAIEHVWFLHEPLDALAGDPKQVVAQAQTWRNIAGELTAVARDHRSAAPPGWLGAAGDAYRGAVDDYAGGVERAAAPAEQLAGLVLSTGAAVGATRAIIRDLIADFLGMIIKRALVAFAAGFVSAGGSVAAFLVSVVMEAVAIAQRITRHLSTMLDALAEASTTSGQLVTGMRGLADQLRDAAPYMRTGAQAITDVADKVPSKQAIEIGKQAFGAKLDDNPQR